MKHEKILIIEDDNDINAMLLAALSNGGYECVQAYSGTEGRLYMEQTKFDLVLLDLMLPGMTGEELLHYIRKNHTTPVIVISAKGEIDAKVDLLTSGADDYMTKPFDLKELLARVAVQLRKSSPTEKVEDHLRHKGLLLKRNSYSAMLKNEEIPLTRQEFKILELLLSHPNKVFSKQEIYDYAWGNFYMGEDKTINVHISNIRQKLKRVVDTEYIDTVWGVGFRLSR
ncbi:response regulator transcription factor [Amphibacillus sp. Q70]|uniref:response regulator transcription factor n=1 Tax=Amphibacillus sp. Q70 TaxID=3453416 RepID=UPI003F8396E3